MLLELEVHKLVLLGDMNGVPMPDLDRSEKKGKLAGGKLPKSFGDMEGNLDLIDIWRHQNPSLKQFTHYSEPHQSWGRIDQIWTTRTLSLRVKSCKIYPRTISDHCALDMEIKNEVKGQYRWRMCENLFDNEEVREKIKGTLKEYLDQNMNKETPIDVVWDASKAVLRGLLIQQNSHRKKVRERKKEDILSQLRNYERKLVINPTDDDAIRASRVLQSQYSAILNQETEWKIKFTKQRYFESANKMGKLLAWQLRKRKKQNVINKIIIEDNIIEDPEEIENRFTQFFEKLYEGGREDSLEIKNYLDHNERRYITEEDRIYLNKEITVNEIKEAIGRMKMGKAPGPDGLSAKYYKTLGEYLAPVLKDVINNILQGGKIPESWKMAYITLIPKSEKEKTDVKNYRPISLLNSDYKIFADIMAGRLKKLLTKYIHKDQAGFLPNRHQKENVRHILNIIEYLDMRIDVPAALIFIDAEKAFDNVSWEFLSQCLEKAGIEGPYMKGIRAIYSEQQARLIINDNLTKPFKIQKGTRQGCPLSPLLFIMILEVIANRIREVVNVRGIKIGKKEFKLKAYADDLVLSVENPVDSTSRVIELLEEFGRLSGFRLNRKKTKILTKNMTEQDKIQLEEKSGIKIANKVKYLGIWLSPKNINLVEDNYSKAWQDIKKDMDTWHRLKLSWTGRMSAIKMCILPRLLFLFQNIPIIKGTSLFKSWQKTLTKYIWQGKRARIKFKYLTDSRERCGFAAPNIRLYYEASCLCWIKEWATLQNTDLLDLEGFNIRFGWHAYLWQEKGEVHRGFSNHVIRGSLLEVWKRYKKLIEKGIPGWLSPTDIIISKKINMSDERCTYEDLLVKTEAGWKVKPYEQLKGRIKEWLLYHQINALWGEHKRMGFSGKKSRYQVEILESNEKLLSKMYKQLLEWDTKEDLVKGALVKWEKDLGHIIEYKNWQILWTKGVKFTACVALRENLEKMIYRWYLTPVKLRKMYKNVDNTCWRCRDKVGTFFHIWWTCDVVKEFWKQIHDELKKILRYNFPKTPELFLLGMIGKEIKKIDQTFIQYAMAAARIQIAQKWKTPDLPTVGEWQMKLYQYIELARLTQKIRQNNTAKLKDEWNKFLIYFESSQGISNLSIDDN
uniref:Reverse transcriptase domain-containing protein n=1 Tax=Podarcis muralis TaxID=64176 RepID=A0A670KCA9_PODMU